MIKTVERVAARYLSAKAVMTWPKLRGNYIEFTRKDMARKGDPHGEEEPFDRHDTFEMTGRVVRGNSPAEYLFESFIDSPSELIGLGLRCGRLVWCPINSSLRMMKSWVQSSSALLRARPH